MANRKGGKQSAQNRQGVKNARRRRRKGMKPWMRGKPMHKQGTGGTDKGWRGGRHLGRAPTYSDRPAKK